MRTRRMIFHMRTTLIIPDPVFRQLKRLAAQRRETLSSVVEEVLRRGLNQPAQDELPPLPVYNCGVPLVNIADRDALYRAMEED